MNEINTPRNDGSIQSGKPESEELEQLQQELDKVKLSIELRVKENKPKFKHAGIAFLIGIGMAALSAIGASAREPHMPNMFFVVIGMISLSSHSLKRKLG